MHEKLDVDFENFTVDESRAQNIRHSVETLKNSGWVVSWKLLLQELGTDECPDSTDTPELPGLSADSTVRVFRCNETESVASGFMLALQAQDLRAYVDEKCLVEISFLPKEDEFAIFYIDENGFTRLPDIMQALELTIKSAKQRKSTRGNTWKERFTKNN